MSSSNSDSDSDGAILGFFSSEDTKQKLQAAKRPAPAQLVVAKGVEGSEALSTERKRAKVAVPKGEGISQSPSAAGSAKEEKEQIGAVVDSRAYFEDEEAETVEEEQHFPPTAVPRIFECHICMRRLDIQEKAQDVKEIVFVYPSEKPTMEVCKSCLQRDRLKAQKLDRTNNKVEYNLTAKCLMPTACKVCGSYEHGSYECMIPESRSGGATSEQDIDPTAPYR